MSSCITDIKYKGHDIEIHIDENEQDNPLDWATPSERKTWFVMQHNRYYVPNELEIDFDEYESWQAIAEAVHKDKGLVYKFVNWYEHSGIAVSLQDNTTPSDMFDAGIVGIIFGESEQDIQSSFIDWQAYIQGDIYAWSTENDGCSGYFGEQGYDQAIADAKQAIDEQVKQEAQAKRKQTIKQNDIATAKKLAKKHGYILAQEVKQ